jgi:hypothetical protein
LTVTTIDFFLCRAICKVLLVTAILLIPAIGQTQANDDSPSMVESFGNDVLADFRQHYRLGPLGKVAIGLGIAGVIANTDADDSIQDFFNDDLSGNTGDNLADFFDGVGDVAHPLYSFPIYMGAMWFGGYNGESESVVATWGANSMRAVLVGTPEVVIFSNAIGGNRPLQGEPGWDPFDDDNGISGHAFLGAVPIITAARQTPKLWLKYTLYATSTLPGLARVYDDKHYFSQALLGWWIAYLSVETIEHTNLGHQTYMQITPVAYADGGGLQLAFEF